MEPLALDMQDITVRYGAVTALDGVSAGFAPGRIHAVVGQNGAGKTTFARTAAGLVTPSGGAVRIGGGLLPTGDVVRARDAGVGLVHQSFALPLSFSVAEAMEFGATRPGRVFTRTGLAARWKPHLEGLDLDVDPRARIRDLPIETQQGLEIARALVTEARVLILDEPTAVLSPAGIEVLFRRVRRLREQGVTVLVILHKIREVLAVADTVTVLRAGKRVAGPLPCADVTAADLSRMIIGDAQPQGDAKDIAALTGAGPAGAVSHEAHQGAPKPVLEFSGFSTRTDDEGAALADLDLDLHPGEILGIAGVEGNGQRTLVRALAGLAERAAGALAIDGHDVTNATLTERRRLGLRIIPFERNIEGLSLTSSLWENWSAGDLLQHGLLRFVRPAALRRSCDAALKRWDVRYHDCQQPAGSLSGGNAQKVILAREIDGQARLIVAAQPTRGLDIGATAFVWNALREARDKGAAVILVSSDLDELFDICDRIVVMYGGRAGGIFSPPYELAAVGDAMTGAVR